MTVVNDVHSKLNETTVDEVVPVDSLESIGAALDRAHATGRRVSIAGGWHAMGGQQFCTGGVVLDMRPLGGVVSIDQKRGLAEVEAGIHSATLRLDRRRKVERVVRLAHASELEGLADGYLYGDFQFAIDPASPDFLQRGICSCYRPVPDDTPLCADHKLSAEDWSRLLHLAHHDKALAYDVYVKHYLATSGQVYLSDRHQLATYVPGYHWGGSSEMISELYVPRPLLADFLAAAARDLRALEADVVYGTVRLLERDDESLLAWARERWACVVLNLHAEHTPSGIEDASVAFRRLIDLALERGGSFYLTYHRWATRRQLFAAYPQLPAFLEAKRAHDPDGLLQSDWYRWLCSTIELEEAA